MKAEVKIILSQLGQKQAILQNQFIGRIHTIEVDSQDENFANVLDLAFVKDGKVILDCTSACQIYGDNQVSITSWDFIPTIQQILNDITGKKKEIEDIKQREAEQLREITLNIVKTKKTINQNFSVAVKNDDVSVNLAATYLSPDWPYPMDKTVLDLPETQAWLEELKFLEKQAREDAQKKVELKLQEEVAKIKAKQLKKKERDERLGLKEGEKDYKIENNAFLQVPVYENHRRGKNWMAIIEIDPSAPGGLARQFAKKANGNYFYIVPNNLKVGDAIEFAADYYSGSGSKSPKRWYGYVVRINSTEIILKECENSQIACSIAKKLQQI